MASLRCVREFESRVRQQREVYEAALERAGQAQWAAYYAIRAHEDVVRLQGSTQALEEARRNEREARQEFETAERAQREAYGELQRLEALLQSLRAGHIP